MRDMPESVSLVVPCYNESARLDMSAFNRYAGQIQFVFVNDGSTDATLAVLRESAPAGAVIVDLPANSGKAEAVRRGMLASLGATQAAWIGFWDADLATPLEEVERFLAYQAMAHARAQAVFGSRVVRLGSEVSRSFVRHILGRVFATVASAILGVRAYDSQCGAKLFRREVVEPVFDTPFCSRWLFDLEIILRLGATQIVECPVRAWKDMAGSKLHAAREIGRTVRDIWAIRRRYLSHGH
jgi:glycosyltransferase involved in cell wall biosynthesis